MPHNIKVMYQTIQLVKDQQLFDLYNIKHDPLNNFNETMLNWRTTKQIDIIRTPN